MICRPSAHHQLSRITHDASGAGTVVSGDYVAPVVAGAPIPGHFIGSADISFEALGSTIDGGLMNGFKISFQVEPLKADLIETETGDLLLVTPDAINPNNMPITVTITFKGQTVIVKTTLATLADDLVAQTKAEGMADVEDHIWNNEDIYKSTVGASRPSAPLTVNDADDMVLPDGDINDIVCFAAGTQIDTVNGPVAVEALAVGDLIVTRDHGAQPIRWIGSKELSGAVLTKNEDLRPIRISAGALGNNTPTTDLMVSPQHRILVRSLIAQRLFGTNEVLAAAKQLLQVEGIDVAQEIDRVEYFHILLDNHEVVLSNGAETESLYTGPQALKSVGAAARAEIFALFPELQDHDYTSPAARQLLSGRQARKLAVRHIQNDKPLMM